MVSVMRVDVAPLKHFLIVAGVTSLLILIGIIIGATGPKEHDSRTYYAYACPGNQHVYDPDTCGGIELDDSTQVWILEVPPLTALNRFWRVQLTFFTQQIGDVARELQVDIEVYGKDDPEILVPYNLIYTKNTTQGAVCIGGPGECDPLLIIDEQDLRYAYYSFTIRVMNGGQLPTDQAPFVGDVKAMIWYGHSGYASLELSLRIFFLFVCSCLLVSFLWWLRATPLDDWAWEQKALVVLLVASITLNNPFYGLQYAARGWFFHFLDALFNIIFLSVLLLFGLLVLDKVRLEDVRMELGKQHLPKYIVVGLFFILGVIVFAWADIRDDYDPIFGHASLLSGLQVLYYIVNTIFCGIVVWLAVLVVMTVPVATAKPYLKTRFLYLAIPTSIVVISILIGIFNGTFGPVNTSTFSMVFFLTLYNTYVWVLTAGFWPIRDRYTARNPSEADSIIHFDRS